MRFLSRSTPPYDLTYDDVFIVPNMMGAILDPSTRAGTTAKMAIDATRLLGVYPRRHTVPDEARARARALIESRRRIQGGLGP